MDTITRLGSFLAIFIAWLIYQENRLQRDHTGGEICKTLALGEDSRIFDDEIAASLPGLVKSLDSLMDKRVEKKLEDPNPQGIYKRVFHPNSWGCVKGKLEILPVNSSERFGLFARAALYDTTIRLSKALVQPDNTPKATSIAMKIFGVSGERVKLEEKDQNVASANKDTFDLVMVHTPTLPAFAIPKEIAWLLEWLDNGSFLKIALYMVLNRPTLLPRLALVVLKGMVISNPFLARHYAIHPSRLGKGNAIRYSLFPCNETRSPGDIMPQPKISYIHEIVQEYLNKNEVCMKLMVQKQSDPCLERTDDIINKWATPWIHVGYLRIPQGSKLSEGTDKPCEELAFNPYHALADNEPLSWVAKMRREIYAEQGARRYEKNNS